MVREIDVQTLQRLLAAQEPIHLLDVRQPWEHALAALPGSQLVPLPLLPTQVESIQPPAGALLVVYCHHGVRSLAAARFLELAGYAQVASLAGGIEAWSCAIDPQVPRY